MTIEEKLINLLAVRGYRIAAGESCTGGMFTSALIGISGASKVVDASFVAYSNDAKCRILGVKPETIKAYGAVSEQTAAEMSEGAARAAGADIGVGITGFADKSGVKSAPAGTVCFGFCVHGFVSTVRVKFDGDRNSVRRQATAFALNSLYSILK